MLVGVASLQNVGILHHKKAKLPKHLQQSVRSEELFYFRNLDVTQVFAVFSRKFSEIFLESILLS